MSDNCKITVVKMGAECAILRRELESEISRRRQRQAEIKKIKDEVLTLAQRLARIEEEEAA